VFSANTFSYGHGNPLTKFDPLGLMACDCNKKTFWNNYKSRKNSNDSVLSKGVKTVTSIAVGGAFNAISTKWGFGAGLGDIVKRQGWKVAIRLHPALGGTLFGTLGNFAINAGLKSVAVGAAFYAGQQAGNLLGAGLDSWADSGAVGSSLLKSLLFGNQDGC